ncbi:MAG: copper transporter, partial [Sciscionella sp.]
ANTSESSVLSTVDDVGTAAGQITTILALQQQLNGAVGRYGTAGNAQAAAPGISAS